MMYFDTVTVALTIVALALSCVVMAWQGVRIVRLERLLWGNA